MFTCMLYHPLVIYTHLPLLIIIRDTLHSLQRGYHLLHHITFCLFVSLYVWLGVGGQGGHVGG